jgi:glycosyltransferase involved in cell wall biosynthesis
MRVLFIDNDVFNEYNGGLYIYKTTGEFVLELIENGNEVELFQTKIKRYSPFHSFNTLGTALKINFSKRYKSKLLTYILAYFRIIPIIFRSDFIYIYYPTNYHFISFFCILLNKKYGFNVRGEANLKDKVANYIFSRACVICTVSDLFTDYINSIGGNAYTQLPILSISNFSHTERVFVDKIFFNLLYVGRLDIEKGIFELIDAVSLLVLSGRNVHLNIVGDGHDLPLIEEKILKLNLQFHVSLNGAIHSQTQLKNIYLKSDIFILPTYHEGFPRVVYEAMLLGIPIVTTIVGGMSGLMKNNYNCYEISPGSSESIKSVLDRLMNNYKESEIVCKNSLYSVELFFKKNCYKQSEIINKELNKLNEKTH